MSVKISRSFKDISLSFTRHPVTNDVAILKNEDAIKKSVVNLVKTNVGERFFNPLLGSNIENYLFELQTTGIESGLEEEITTLLNNFEPRIKLNDVNIKSIFDSNELEIKISYDIIGLPFPEQNIEFILQPSKV